MNTIFYTDEKGTWQPFHKTKHLFFLEVLTVAQLIKPFPSFMNLEDLFPLYHRSTFRPCTVLSSPVYISS